MTLDLSNVNLEKLIYDSIYIKNRTNLFSDLRRSFYNEVCKELKVSNIEISKNQISGSTDLIGHGHTELTPIKAPHGELLNINFCARYGYSIYSLEAINYQFGLYTDYYSLQSFNRNKNFSIGNILIPVKTNGFEFDVKESDQIKVVGFSSDIRKNKRKPYLVLLGVHFNHEAIKIIINKYLTDYTNPILDEVKFSTTSYPILFTCRKTGELYTCKCFEGYIDWETDFYRFAPKLSQHKFIKDKIRNLTYLKGICHLCTNTTPLLDYGSSMYYSSFLVKFLPYYSLMNKKRAGSIFSFHETDKKMTENELRVKFGYYKIGEKWTTETLLYNMLSEIFTNDEVIFHYRGKEMEGLELDIWIPKFKLGIEYQGIQHFKAIEHWGGEKTLKKQKLKDKKKKEICKSLNYKLIEFRYDEDISKDLILRKLEENKILVRNI